MRNFLKLVAFYQRKFQEAFRRKDSDRVLSLMTDVLEWTFSTRETWVLVEVLLLFAVILENMQNYDLSSFFFS
jgi:hypothetical protein